MLFEFRLPATGERDRPERLEVGLEGERFC